jgi:hypothetical protein
VDEGLPKQGLLAGEFLVLCFLVCKPGWRAFEKEFAGIVQW